MLPDSKEGFFPLRDFVEYVKLPEWLPKWQDQKVEDILKRISLAIFSTDIFDRPSFAQTATEKLIEYDKIYDVVTPYGDKISRIFEKVVRVTAQYRQIKGVVVDHAFPVDYKMKSVNELMTEYALAKSSGLSPQSLWSIESDILKKQYVNNPAEYQFIKAQSRFKPFVDKSVEEIVLILSSRDNSDSDKILYENFSRIFKQIKDESPEFATWPKDKQDTEVLRVINEVSNNIKYKQLGLPDFI